MSWNELRQDALDWCAEDRSISARLPVLAYGIFLAWKTALRPDLFTPFDFLNLGIHELGHVVCMPFGQWIGVLGGSLAQVVAPIFGAGQFLRQRDYFAAAFAFGWLGESLANLSVYIGDARKQELPLANLFGGDPIHDWNFLLTSMNKLAMDTTYAKRVQALGFASNLLFLCLGVWLVRRMKRAAP
ncbi:MAG TPA: hypothetical protein VIH99_12750 [Bdellovibrionota bacterium]|jgi:hypothetical protein